MTRLACFGSLHRTLVRGLLAASLLGAAACSGDAGDRCEKNSDCASGLTCALSGIDGKCTAPTHLTDAAVDNAPADTGEDLMSVDAEQDAGTD